MDDVTVVIPMYNSEYTIEKTLDSIFNQTVLYPIKEIIIVNDGSTDNSLNVVKKYRSNQKQIKISIYTQDNKGVSSARNLGMSKVKTKWIALLDSDDVWLSNKIEHQKNILEDNPSIDFIGGEVSDKPMMILFRKVDHLYKASVKDLLIKPFPATPTVVFKREILESVQWFDEKQYYSEDMKFFIGICGKFNFYYSPEKIVICGEGKPRFGASGLSGNLKEMHRGSQKNLTFFYDQGYINKGFYITVKLYNELKYIRRIILTKLYKLKKGIK